MIGKSMNKETLEALKKSIEKWWYIWNKDTKERGIQDCALCALYYYEAPVNTQVCKKCPIYKHTNARFCSNTPYSEFVMADAAFLQNQQSINLLKNRRNAAHEMFNFLVELLPKNEFWEAPDGWIYYHD